MSPPGRPKCEYRSAQHEGSLMRHPVSTRRRFAPRWDGGMLKRAICLVLALCVSGCAIQQPLVRQFADGRQWQLWEPLGFAFGQPRTLVEVPAGFVTDFASIPRVLWEILPPQGRYSSSAVMHDYLYWTQLCSKDEADLALLYAMEEQQVPLATRRAVYLGVRTSTAQESWDRNTGERNAGRVRVVPTRFRSAPPNVIWDGYRADIENKGAQDPPVKADPHLCEVLASLAG
jgi:hypothetical protein